MDHRTRGSSDKLVAVNGHDDFSGDRRSLQYDALKSGQVFKIIVTDQAMPVAYSVDFGQLGSDSLVPGRRPLPMVDKTAVSTNRTTKMMLAVPASKSARIIPGNDFLPGLLRHLISSSCEDWLGWVVTAATIVPRYCISRRKLSCFDTFPSASRKCVMLVTQISTSP